MRFLENLFIKFFSLIVFILSIFIILIGLDFINIDTLTNLVKWLFITELRGKITLIVCLILVFVSLKIIITSRGKPKSGKDGIILENNTGKLIISKESLDNLIFNAAKDIPGAENITSKTYLDLDQNLKVFVTVNVTSDVSIKELSTALQSKIKSSIKQTADLDVSEVNVKIKNIINKKSKRIKDNYNKKEEIKPIDNDSKKENENTIVVNQNEENNNEASDELNNE